MKVGKFVADMLYALIIICFLWAGISYGEIIIKTGMGNPEYSKGNIIINIFGYKTDAELNS